MINLAPSDVNLGVSVELPAAGNAATSATLDLQAIAPNSSAWRLGLFRVSFPAVAGHETAADSITVALKAAPPSLTTGASAAAPSTPPAGAFITPAVAETLSVAGVAATGSAAGNYYMHMPLDSNGSTYQFYEFVITVPASATTASEVVNIEFIPTRG
ncbi:MAG: hypothetical protein KGL39_47495 [Patescibacteria group bacterium]|nr:hypothetical protein [Patescibacteria group bacterium]